MFVFIQWLKEHEATIKNSRGLSQAFSFSHLLFLNLFWLLFLPHKPTPSQFFISFLQTDSQICSLSFLFPIWFLCFTLTHISFHFPSCHNSWLVLWYKNNMSHCFTIMLWPSSFFSAKECKTLNQPYGFMWPNSLTCDLSSLTSAYVLKQCGHPHLV